MNVVRLCGGLGNQLFQYAFGKAQKQLGITVTYDTIWYSKSHTPPRPLLLNKFNTDLEGPRPIQYVRTITEEGFRPKKIFDLGFKYVGYWQSPIYHKNIYSILQNEFKVKEQFYTPEYLELKRKVTQSNSVSLHVRRGDYLDKGNQYVLPLEYYHKALKILTNLKGEYSIYIFSDDIPWCRKHFSNASFVQLEDYLELELMSHCKHNIIAKSTFSWWGAYLNENANKAVIAPKRWVTRMVDQELIDKKGLILDSWIKI